MNDLNENRSFSRDVLHGVSFVWGTLLVCFLAMVCSASASARSLRYLGWIEIESAVYSSPNWLAWCTLYFGNTVPCLGMAGSGFIGLRHVVMSYDSPQAFEFSGSSQFGSSSVTCVAPLGKLCGQCSNESNSSTVLVSLGFVATLGGLLLSLAQLHIPTLVSHRRIAKFVQLSLAAWCFISAAVPLAEMRKCVSNVAFNQPVKNGPMIAVVAVTLVVTVGLCAVLLLVNPTDHAAFITKTLAPKVRPMVNKSMGLSRSTSTKRAKPMPRRSSRIKVAPAVTAIKLPAQLSPRTARSSSSDSATSAETPSSIYAATHSSRAVPATDLISRKTPAPPQSRTPAAHPRSPPPHRPLAAGLIFQRPKPSKSPALGMNPPKPPAPPQSRTPAAHPRSPPPHRPLAAGSTFQRPNPSQSPALGMDSIGKASLFHKLARRGSVGLVSSSPPSSRPSVPPRHLMRRSPPGTDATKS